MMHLKVANHDSGHYQVIVAGSAVSGTDDMFLKTEEDKELSLKTEVYDSKTGV